MRNNKPLSSMVRHMHNHELIGLAKNRFIDTETQNQIAKHPYRRAKSYLAMNSGLVDSAREILWNLPGYVFKCELLASGQYDESEEQKDKYIELYEKYGKKLRTRSRWRLHTAFLERGFWMGYDHQRRGPRHPPVPGEILEDFYKKDIELANQPDLGGEMISRWDRDRIARALIHHPNTPCSVIVKMSSSYSSESLRLDALRRMASTNNKLKPE